MEFGDLLGKIRGGDKDAPKSFLAIELTDEIVQAAVWHVEAGQTDVAAIGTPIEWDGDKADLNELVTAADATVSSGTEGMDEEPNEIIFGVAANWAGPDGILPDKLSLIKKICKELELKPLGFVVVTDSLLRYLKMQEGTPASSILVQVARDSVTVSLVYLGKLSASEILGRSDDISADVEEGLSRFAGETELPSRILVFNSMHSLDDEVQNLLSYDWKSKFNFLHIPKIESLPKDILIRSIAVAGGSEVAKSIGFDISDSSAEAMAKAEPVPATPDFPKSDENVSNVIPVNKKEGKPFTGSIESVGGLLSAEDFGFAPDFPAGELDKKPKPSIARPVPSASVVNLREPEIEETVAVSRPSTSSKISLPQVKLPSMTLPKLKLPEMNFPALKLGKPILLLGAALLLLVVGFIAAVWMVPKAVVTIAVEPKELIQNIDLVLSTSATGVDVETSTVPGTLVSKEIEGDESTVTTGKKTVGETAGGEVTIYNRTTANKTFSKDTVLTAKSLKFTLVDNVTVASKSAGSDYIDVPGKAKVKIRARNIGAEGNLEANTEFIIENFAKDTYVAKNEDALSGGSSQDVQVVSKADKDQVKNALISRLKEEGRTALSTEQGAGIGIYIMGNGTEIVDENYSAEIGEETDSLTASFTMALKGISYRAGDVDDLTTRKLAMTLPEGYERTADLPLVELGEVKEEVADGVSLQAKIQVKLLPKLNSASISESLRGQSAASVPGYLSNVIGMKSAEVSITPEWLPPRFKRMPRNPENINVVVVPSQ